jgi:protein gp37
MAKKSQIGWTEMTWNPVTGCDKVSPGCKHCYAERMAHRLQLMGSPRYESGFKITLQEDIVELPKQWKSPKKIFVNSMSDLFHKKVPTHFIQNVFKTMNDCPQHQFQVLTKRAERLEELAPMLKWSKNIWMGVSVENQDYIHRIDHLRKVPANIRFLSIEPLLSPINEISLEGIHWVIVGGESGPEARPAQREWVVKLHSICKKQHVPFFFKQWGGVQKHRTGRELYGKTYDEMPLDYEKKLDQNGKLRVA